MSLSKNNNVMRNLEKAKNYLDRAQISLLTAQVEDPEDIEQVTIDLSEYVQAVQSLGNAVVRCYQSVHEKAVEQRIEIEERKQERSK